MKRVLSLLLVAAPVVAGAQSTGIKLEPVGESAPITSESSGQERLELPEKKKEKADIEKIQVTGSHIKRIEAEGASPVQTLSRQDLDKSGYNSVADVLRDQAANSFGSTREASGSNAAGVAHVNLRGLGSSNTLVLLNGQRLPSDAVTGAVDLNLIPMAAVERVEILKDGASAIYGSDALGGVVNIITRKDFNGTEAGFNISVPEGIGGQKQEVSVVSGVNKGKFNMVNVAQYRDNFAVFSRDRDWTNKGMSNFGSPGSYRNSNGTWNADPNCPPDRLVSTPGGTFCSFKYSDYATELPALQQFGLLSESNYELNSRVRLKARVGGTRKTAQWSFAAAPDTFTIPGSIADTLGPGGTPLPGATPGQDLQVRYRVTELGTRDTKIESNAYNLLLGGTVALKDSWELEVNAGHNRVHSLDRGVNGYALTKALNDAIASGAFNPFAPEGQRGTLEGAKYQTMEETVSQLSSVEAKVTGELAQFSSGPVGLAIGTTFTFQKYADKFDDRSVADEVFGNAGSSGGGQRDTRAVFSEISVPITQSTEIQLAGRYDQYSDFGETVNPKAAILHKVTPNFLLRGSVGTGFKAPLMQDLYAATSNGNPTFIDHVSCAREKAAGGQTPACIPQQYNVVSSGNKGLKEERSLSYNAGAVFQANRDLSFGTDWFLTKMNNVVGIDYGDAMRAESRGIDLASRGVIVHRDANGYIDSIEAPMQNLAAQEVSGIDVSAGYRIKRMKFDVNHSHLLYFKEEGFPGTGSVNKLGQKGKPAWRNVASIAVSPSDRHTVSLDGITTAGHEKAVAEMGNLRPYTQVDLQYTYINRRQGQFTAGVRNLMGTVPPLDDSSPTAPLDVTLYDQIGRQVYAGYKATF